MPDISKLNIDSELLSSLSEQEKRELSKILSDLSKGKTESYDDLIYEDYWEIPVDIETFITDDRYLGKAWKTSDGKSKIFPYWLNAIKKILPTNITTSVNNAIFSGARGLGKSEWAVTLMTYLMYRVMCLKDPLTFYNLKPTDKICFAFMNITKDLAERIGISKFQETVKSSPWFMERGTLSGRDIKLWEPPEPIKIIIGSEASHVIGQPVYAAFFDEISFIRNQNIDKQKAKAMDMIDTAIGGMKTRFINHGKNPTLLILASSKRSEKSFLESHMKKKLESEKENVFIVDEPVWNVRPPSEYSGKRFNLALGNKFLASQVLQDTDDIQLWKNRGYKIIKVPIEYRADFLDDIDRALCDFAGISSSEISKYISGSAVQEIINETLHNPFSRDIVEVGNGAEDTTQYYDFFDLEKVPKDMMSRPLYIHMDMSISGDMTGIAGIWIKGKKIATEDVSQANDLFFSLAFSVSIKAPKGRQISFEKNRNFIYWLRDKGFKIKGVSTDSFQSTDTGQTLSAKGYNYQVISVDKVGSNHICIPYQYFRSTIYEKRLEMYRSNTLIDEIIDLERNINTGKIDHPDGGRKDVCDAVCGAIFNASQYAEQFAYDYGEDLYGIMESNNDALTNPNANRKQIVLDFEQELQKVLQQPKSINDIKKEQENLSNQYPPVFVADNMLIW